MRRLLLIFALCFLMSATQLWGQAHTQSISFDDLGLGGGTATSGTYFTTDTFSFDVYLTYNGYNSYGFSLVLEAPQLNNFAGSISIIGETYGPVFSDPSTTLSFPVPFNYPNSASPGYLAELRDLGASDPGIGPTFMAHPPATYFVAHISFAINGAMPGVYTIRSTPNGFSEVTDTSFHDNLLPEEDYTITIIPEPGTVSLFGLGAIGLVAALRKRKR